MSPLYLSLIVVLSLAAVPGVNFGVPFLVGHLSRLNLNRRARKARAVVLTFDDGPGRQLTPAVLQLLAEKNVKASFFVLGRHVRGRESLVRRIWEQGHDVCSHGYSHRHIWKTGPWKGIQDVLRGRYVLDAVLKQHGTRYVFRPPYGKLDLLTLIYLWLTRVRICYWTADSTDTWATSAMNARRAAELIHRNGGGVVLMHDFDRRLPGVHRMVLDAIAAVVDVAREDGLKIMTLSELMQGENHA